MFLAPSQLKAWPGGGGGGDLLREAVQTEALDRTCPQPSKVTGPPCTGEPPRPWVEAGKRSQTAPGAI